MDISSPIHTKLSGSFQHNYPPQQQYLLHHRFIHLETIAKQDEKSIESGESTPNSKSVILENENKQHKHWIEYKTRNKPISRRSYHSAVVYNNYLYIYGGYEMNHGIMPDFYKINFGACESQLTWIKLDIDKNTDYPGPLFRHTAIIYDDWMYIYGGQITSTQNTDRFYKFDFQNEKFSEIKPNSSDLKPPPLDSHSANIWRRDNSGDNKTVMVINCGFIGGSIGEYTNAIWEYDFSSSKWLELFKHIPGNSMNYPSGRMDQSSVIIKDILYIFGGTDSENKYNEFWKFNLLSRNWTLNEACKFVPDPRNGHTMNIIDNDNIILFGGIHDIAHERNDIHIYNIQKNEWKIVEGDPNLHHKSQTVIEPKHNYHHSSPKNLNSRRVSNRYRERINSEDKKVIDLTGTKISKFKDMQVKNNSERTDTSKKDNKKPYLIGKKLIQSNHSKYIPEVSMSWLGQKSVNNNTLNTKDKSDLSSSLSPNKLYTCSPTQFQKERQFHIEKRILLSHFEVSSDQISTLRISSPTTQAMRNSIDSMQSIQQKHNRHNSNNIASMTMTKRQDEINNLRTELLLTNGTYGGLSHITYGKKPCARNGHSANIINNRLIIFGGDRHKMCFNDLHGLDLDYMQNFSLKSYLSQLG